MQPFHYGTDKIIQLPAPILHGEMSLEEAMAKRESIRHFTSEALTPSELSQILWAAQGITRTWGGRTAPCYLYMEAGHAAQNILLQAVSLGLGAVPIGAFHDDRIRNVLNLPVDNEPLYLIPLGHKRK